MKKIIPKKAVHSGKKWLLIKFYKHEKLLLVSVGQILKTLQCHMLLDIEKFEHGRNTVH